MYSLAAIAYELLTGRRIPGPNALPGLTLQNASRERAAAVRSVLEWALAEAPENRCDTTGALVVALERTEEGDMQLAGSPAAAKDGAPTPSADNDEVPPESAMLAAASAPLTDLEDPEPGLPPEPAAAPVEKPKRSRRSTRFPRAQHEAEPPTSPAEKPQDAEADVPTDTPALDEFAPESWLASSADLAMAVEAEPLMAAAEGGDLGPEAGKSAAPSRFHADPVEASPAARPPWVSEASGGRATGRAIRGVGAIPSFWAMLTLSAGLAIGFAAGYLVRGPAADRAVSPQEMTGQAFSERPVAEPPTPTVGTGPAGADRPLPTPGPADRGIQTGTERPTAALGVAPRPTPARPPATPPSDPGRGRLLVRSTPAGAEVQVNGERRGETPLALRDLAYGSYQIHVRRDGYTTESRRIILSADQPVSSLVLTLRAAGPEVATTPPAAERASVGSIYVDSRPRGARIILDGRLVGTTPALLSSLPPGPHEIRLERDGYRAWGVAVQVKAQEQARVAASLEPLP